MINTDDVLAILKANGPSTCGEVARALGVKSSEARPYLEDLKESGKVMHNWCKGVYSA